MGQTRPPSPRGTVRGHLHTWQLIRNVNRYTTWHVSPLHDNTACGTTVLQVASTHYFTAVGKQTTVQIHNSVTRTSALPAEHSWRPVLPAQLLPGSRTDGPGALPASRTWRPVARKHVQMLSACTPSLAGDDVTRGNLCAQASRRDTRFAKHHAPTVVTSRSRSCARPAPAFLGGLQWRRARCAAADGPEDDWGRRRAVGLLNNMS